MGTILVAGSAVAYSFAGYFTRLIPLDVMTLLFWRSLFAGLTLAALIVARERRGTWAAIRSIGGPGLLVAVTGVLSAYLYLAALRATTVADVSIIFATLPFVTAGLAWVLLRERPSWRTVVASLVTLIGSAVMVGGAAGAGHLRGDLLALGMTLTWAAVVVLLRRGRPVSMLPAIVLSCFLMAAVAAPMARLGPLARLPLVELALFGGVQLGMGLLLLTLGVRRISAARAALIGLLDAPLAPLWVWLAFDETPGVTTLVGGGIVLAAVAWSMRPAPAAVAELTSPALRPDRTCPM